MFFNILREKRGILREERGDTASHAHCEWEPCALRMGAMRADTHNFFAGLERAA